ncbi:MAG: methionyl-tRNA formyltransferase [Burkholderia sp.]|nr:methionyl-tRNA formyltransferase [Burkholderia sp.]
MTTHFLRVIFFGTPEFSAVALAAIHKAGFRVELVFTQPDSRSARGMRMQASAVKRYAIDNGIPVAQPISLVSSSSGMVCSEIPNAIALLRATPHDVIIVAAYGIILPQEVLSIPYYGCINIHPSLLPRWRGAAPIHRAIESGDKETGITLIQMDTGLDTGAILKSIRVPISLEDTTSTLNNKLSYVAAQLIVNTLTQLEQSGRLLSTPQSEYGVTYAEKIKKHESILDWRKSANTLARQVRAFDPSPGSIGILNGLMIKIWKAEPIVTNSRELIGTIIESGPDGVIVICGIDALRIMQLQRPSGKRLSARQFLTGTALDVGERFSILDSG